MEELSLDGPPPPPLASPPPSPPPAAGSTPSFERRAKVERIRGRIIRASPDLDPDRQRPPSSYGSGCSDEAELAVELAGVLPRGRASPAFELEVLKVERAPVRAVPTAARWLAQQEGDTHAADDKERHEEGEPQPAKGAAEEAGPSPARRLWAMQRGSWPHIGVGLLFACGSGTLPLYGFLQLLELFTISFSLSADTIRADTVYFTGLILGVMGGTILCFWADTALLGIAAARLTHRMRDEGFAAFLGQDIGFFDAAENAAGELTGFLADKVTLVEFLTGGQV